MPCSNASRQSLSRITASLQNCLEKKTSYALAFVSVATPDLVRDAIIDTVYV